MKLEQLYQIIEIEKQQSISKAARVLFASQSSLSGALNSLEEEIGVRLFERSSSGVTPTQEGRDVLQLTRQALECCDMIVNYGQKTRQLHGEVTLYVTPAYGYLFSELMMEFKNRFPQATLDMHVESPEKIVEALSQGQARIGLTMWGFTEEQTQEVLEKAGLGFEVFKSHNLMLFVSRDNQFAENDHVTLADVSQERFISYSAAYWASLNKQLHASLEPVVMTDREALKRMVSAGQGIAVLPETFAKHDLYCEQGIIKMIPIIGTENFAQGEDYILYSAKRQLTLLEKKTLEILREILQELEID